MFFLTRIAVEVFTPFILSILLFLAGTLFVIGRKNRMALACNIVGLCVILSFGYGVWTNDRIKEREALFLPFAANGIVPDKLKDIAYIVVLGSGHVSDDRLPTTSQVGGSSMFRIVEGKRISDLLPYAKVVITGGIGYDPVPNAKVVGDVAKIIGFEEERLIIENRPRNTEEEADCVLRLVGDDSFVLVTSAVHMKRAMHIFTARGMAPVAAPTDYIYKTQKNVPAAFFLPKAGNLELARHLIYEYMGSIWIKLKLTLKNFL